MWGWEIKIMYLDFVYTSHDIAHAQWWTSIVCVSVYVLGRISRKSLEIETWFYGRTNRKWLSHYGSSRSACPKVGGHLAPMCYTHRVNQGELSQCFEHDDDSTINIVLVLLLFIIMAYGAPFGLRTSTCRALTSVMLWMTSCIKAYSTICE